ncbi:hypothetical protein ARMGADRAFT_1064423 [Armillaria gallica]|uniref:Integral membrane protein n=1 Tax=Armillaria gallica TaxID=47427 RepID=A0A2H3D6C7_ARMGA|nr:hypothetical protein ARMGADRAFT_1064423 [Armillaria gallica]
MRGVLCVSFLDHLRSRCARTSSSFMAAAILPDLTLDKAIAFQELDVALNATILYYLLCGLYTGILAVTLWNISTTKPQHIGRAMVIIIVVLHITTIVDLAITWSEIHSVFVDQGQDLWSKFDAYISPDAVSSIGAATVGAICGILADSTMIWRCWLVWGRRWLIVLLPVVFLIAGTLFKGIDTHRTGLFSPAPLDVLYASCMLASTLWCTSLIIYRVVTVARAGGGLKDYRHVLEVLVESSALWSMSLIVYIALLARTAISSVYFDILTTVARGAAPTILVGRVAAGHARPDDSWQGSVISGPLRFGAHSGSRGAQPNSMMSHDIEALELEIDKEYGHSTLAEGGACEDGSEVQRGLGDVSVDSGCHDIRQDSSDIQQGKDVEYGHHM